MVSQQDQIRAVFILTNNPWTSRNGKTSPDDICCPAKVLRRLAVFRPNATVNRFHQPRHLHVLGLRLVQILCLLKSKPCRILPSQSFPILSSLYRSQTQTHLHFKLEVSEWSFQPRPTFQTLVLLKIRVIKKKDTRNDTTPVSLAFALGFQAHKPPTPSLTKHPPSHP